MSAGKQLREKNIITDKHDGVTIKVRRASMMVRLVNNDLPMVIANALTRAVDDPEDPAEIVPPTVDVEDSKTLLSYQINLAIDCCLQPRIVNQKDDLTDDEISVEDAWECGLIRKVYELATGMTDAVADEVQRLEKFRANERGSGVIADSGDDGENLRAKTISFN